MKLFAIVLCCLGSMAQAQLGTFTTLTTTWNGESRTYSVYLPPVVQPNPALVIALHGTTIAAQSAPPLTVCTHLMGWDAIADANGFVLVCPIASYIPGNPTGRFLWDSYGLDQYFPAPPDDSGFLRSLILAMQQPETSGGFSVDPTRTFVMGFSSGAMMAHRACIENADLVAACAMLSGGVWVDSPSPPIPPPSRPVSILELHGDADPILGYCGGTLLPTPNGPSVTVPSVDVDVNYWLAADGLGANAATLCSNGAPSANVFQLDSKSPTGRTEVQFVRELSYGHTYGAWNISSTWEFFSTHARSSFTMAANPESITVASPGQSGSTTLTFTAKNGLTGSATLSPSTCSALPSESACSFSPSTVSFTSSITSVPVTLTIKTTAASARALWVGSRPPVLPGLRAIPAACLVGACFLLVNRRRRWRAVPALIGLVVLASTLSCGGGSGIGSTWNPGTPVGNYTGVTVAVTINGVTQSIKNLSVNVQ